MKALEGEGEEERQGEGAERVGSSREWRCWRRVRRGGEGERAAGRGRAGRGKEREVLGP